jgi:hypothetical protein
MKWRQQWEVDGALKTWQPSETLLTYYPYGSTGVDKEDSPVVIVPFGGLDIVGMLHAVGRQDFIKMTIQVLEKYMQEAAERGVQKVSVIFDLEAFNLRQYAWRPAGEVIISLIQMYEANYPEILKTCYIINAPRVFAIAFNVIKRFLNEYTLGKMLIFKNDSKKWKKAILETIDPSNLPQHYGGNLTDPDGNPRCITRVNQGGKVPKHLYKRSFEQNPDSVTAKQYTTAVIKKGEKLLLDYIVADEGCFLKWEFRTESHDIRFGVTLKDADGNSTAVVPHKRVAAHQIDESGVVACQSPATYTVTFDNSYSLLRSKKLHYEILVTPPVEKMNILPQEDENIDEGVTSTAATTSVHNSV